MNDANQNDFNLVGFTPDELAAMAINHIYAAQQATEFFEQSVKLNESKLIAMYREKPGPIDENIVRIGDLAFLRRGIDESLYDLSHHLQSVFKTLKRLEKKARRPS